MPLYQTFRDSSGATWRQPIPERVRLKMHICFLMDDVEAALTKASVALAQEGVRLISHGSSTDQDELRQHWHDTAVTFKDEIERIAAPANNLVTALKALFEI